MRYITQRGSILLGSVIFMIIMFVVGATVLDLARTNYGLMARSGERAEALAVAESEMEYLFFQFKSQCLEGTRASDVAATLASEPNAVLDNSETPTTIQQPFMPIHRAAGWRVRRSLSTDRSTIQGALDGGTKYGQFTYVNARIEILPPIGSPYGDSLNIRIGRRFVNSSRTIFQYSIFYEGDLEITPGTTTVIDGDVAVSGNVYLGIVSGQTLTINDKIKYVNGKLFNLTEQGATIYHNPNGPTGLTPPANLVAPSIADPDSQLETLDQPENLLGGIDPESTATVRDDLFGPVDQSDSDWAEDEDLLAEAMNNVYRSIIVPPPSASTTGTATSEYPHATSSTGDDPAIAATRAYNRADIVINVAANGTISAVKRNGDGSTASITSSLASAVTASTPIYDQREEANVSLVNIDVGALKTILEGGSSPVPGFNGLIYVNQLGATSSTPAAVRLMNAEQLPNVDNRGFSVATNGGLYVQGSYNSRVGNDKTKRVPAMLMSDALTVLSAGWTDANASAALSSRMANNLVTDDAATADIDESKVTTINAGLLTGTSTTNGSYTSGGAQNLVRYLENWSGATVNYLGSVGRLFQSKHFDSSYRGPSTIYRPPNRVFAYDSDLGKQPPPGSPIITEYGRGNFFVW